MLSYIVGGNKTLVSTSENVVYEQENNADDLLFLVPQMYGDVDLSTCECTLNTINQDGVANVIILKKDAELYKDRLQFKYTLTTQYTYKDGGVRLWLMFTNGASNIVLKTSEATFEIKNSTLVSGEVPQSSLDLLTQWELRMESTYTRAEAAKTAAETAQAISEDAQVASEESALNASESEINAAASEDNALVYAGEAQVSAGNAAASEANALEAKTSAEDSATSAAESKDAAEQHKIEAAQSATNAKSSELVAVESEENTVLYMQTTSNKATEATNASLVAIQKKYETAADVNATAENKQSVAGMKQSVEQMQSEINSTISAFEISKGTPNGVATLDANAKVLQTAKNSDALGGNPAIHYATKESVDGLTVEVADKVKSVSFSQDSAKLNVFKDDSSSALTLKGLLQSVTEDSTTGSVTFHLYDGTDIVWNKGKDTFLSSAYYASDAQTIVLVMSNGNTVEIPAGDLIDVYTGSYTDTTTVDVSNNVIYVDVRVSAVADNTLEAKTDGLYSKHPKDLGYKTKTENDALYVGVSGTAANSDKLNNKDEANLNVNHAVSADSLATARTFTFSGAASGSASFDGSANVNVSLTHTYSPFLVLTEPESESTPVTWDITANNRMAITLTQEHTLTISNLVAGFYGVCHSYGAGFNLTALETDGWNIDPTATYLTLTGTDQYYVHTFAYDGVKKSYRRTVRG